MRKLQRCQLASYLGPIAVASPDVLSWDDIREEVVRNCVANGDSVPTAPVDYIAVTVGAFSRHVYFTCLRLGALMKG